MNDLFNIDTASPLPIASCSLPIAYCRLPTALCRFFPFAVFLHMLLPQFVSAQAANYTNNMGMEFVLIQPGKFRLGRFQPPFPVPARDATNAKEAGTQERYKESEYAMAEKLATQDATPGFLVSIEKPFYIGKFEVTQSQWKKVMGSNPSTFRDDTQPGTLARPVENVSWDDAQRFLKKLNALQKETIYRLPTEFEWEYAARAGAEDDISWADISLSAQLGTRSTNIAGQKTPNAWGLYDMLGNVWEWVQDFYNEKIFADPIPPASGKVHVLKGASFVGDVKNATYMTHAAGPGNGWDVGFRVVMEVTGRTKN